MGTEEPSRLTKLIAEIASRYQDIEQAIAALLKRTAGYKSYQDYLLRTGARTVLHSRRGQQRGEAKTMPTPAPTTPTGPSRRSPTAPATRC